MRARRSPRRPGRGEAVGGPAPPPRPIRPRLHRACAGPRPMKWASEARASVGVRDRRLWVALRRHLTSCAVGLLTHRAAIARQWRDNARARRVGRPAARCGVVPVGARVTPKTRGRLRLPAKRAQQAGRLNVARRRLSPSESLPFWQSPSWSQVPGPRSRRSPRERKSHFCKVTYVNGRAQKQRVF